jgi:hypothetical protein
MCAYEHDFGGNYIITIVKTTKKCVIVLSVLNLVFDFVKCNHPILPGGFWRIFASDLADLNFFIWQRWFLCERAVF